MTDRLRARLLAVGWTLGILTACTIPGTALPSTTLWDFDKAIHFLLFAGFGWLWLKALPWRLRTRLGAVLGTGLAFAILSEFYQGILPWEREPDLLDALANTLGLLAALAVGLWRRPHRAT